MKKGLSLKSIIISCVGLLGAIATFLPWATVSFLGVSMSTNGIAEGASDGWFTLIAFAAVIGLTCAFITKEDSPLWAKIVTSVVSLLPIVVGLYNIININTKTMGLGSAGIGLYMVLILGIATAALPWIPFKNMIGGEKK